MKKLMLYVLGLCLLTGSGYAACVLGQFCADDTGASVAGLGVDGNGFAMPVKSSTTISTTAPRYAGQEIVCNTCANAGLGNVGICVSTSAVGSPWVMISSSSQKCQ